ncbi:MAG: hypothetical protein IPH80_20305 [Myxococcales bacterium]|nr:hypothetical protein [Myxococcales bacterium]
MRALLLASCLVTISACPGPSPTTIDAPDDLDCGDRLTLTVRAPVVGYRPIAEAGDGAELVLGFQGFRYVYVRGRLDADPGVVSAAVRVTLDGGAPRSQPVQPAFGPAAGGGVETVPLQVFFNDDPLPGLIDHGVTLELRLGSRCLASGHTVLRYDPSCIEGPDGQPVCDGGDGAPDGGL